MPGGWWGINSKYSDLIMGYDIGRILEVIMSKVKKSTLMYLMN